MDNNKDSGTNLAFWVPGSAVILSLVVSMFALTREPFLELRPIGEQFQAQLPIEARLWQDPFDALERYRKKLAGTDELKRLCTPEIDSLAQADKTPAPEIMVALVEGGPYAYDVERRRRTRYALLAGFKNSHRVPDQEQYIHCLKLSSDLSVGLSGASGIDVPYEVFISNPFAPPESLPGTPSPADKTYVFWLKQDALGQSPLKALEKLRQTLSCKTGITSMCYSPPGNAPALKVIGPATSAVLRDMFQDEDSGHATPTVEIYSPLATADNKTLDQGYIKRTPSLASKPPMKLLRTVSDDGTMTQLILDELRLRGVDPSAGVRCHQGNMQKVGSPCSPELGRASSHIALIAEWDSFYARALTESFKSQVATDAELGPNDNKAVIDQWVLRFSYLRGLDGRLPEDAVKNEKVPDTAGSKSNKAGPEIDLSPLEKSDGNSQLDYLRRLADHIAEVDATYRRNGENGIRAIGVLGVDIYDKLLVLQALKSRMPYKIYFSTNLDARMLQRGETQITRNLILAAPYGLELTRALQQDVPPFRDSLQSAVFVSVLAALSSQTFDVKRAKFDYSKSELLSPDIYEIGTSGFIPLASDTAASRPLNCEAPTANQGIRPHDLMALSCLQDRSPPPYPETSPSLRDQVDHALAYFGAGPLTLILLVFAGFIVWRWISGSQKDNKLAPANWVRGIPMALYMIAVVSAFVAMRYWQAEFLWLSFGLILAGIITTNLTRSEKAGASVAANIDNGVYDSSAWYIVIPIVVYVLVLMMAYQMRSTLTLNGMGEPMFLFEGISSWPCAALRLLAILICLSALAWGWRNLRINRQEIEKSYHLSRLMRRYQLSVWSQIVRLKRRGKDWDFRTWCNELGHWLLLALLPLSTASTDWENSKAVQKVHKPVPGGRRMISTVRYWAEHCVCGSFGARLLRAMLCTWIYLVVTSVLFVAWPLEQIPVRGQSSLWLPLWMLSTIMFHILVFWVVDANLLLTRFIRHLSDLHAVWPRTLQREHEKIFGTREHICIDEWIDLQLIAKRTSAVSRLIYAPTVVLLILVASRNSYFDNWQTPPSTIIIYLLSGLILLMSALSLRRAAEKARTVALQRIDAYLLETPVETPYYDKFRMVRERVATLNTGSFSRYSEDPLIRALLLSLTGIGGSALVDALNYAKF